jgi:hypothetical protein
MTSAEQPAMNETPPHRIMQKGWATQLFATPLPEASVLLRGELDQLLQQKIQPDEMIRITEIARVLAMGIHKKWMPLYQSDGRAFSEDVSLWQSLWSLYSAELKPLLSGDERLTRHKALLLQRALFVGKQIRLIHALAYKFFPEQYWQEIHAYFRFAEMLKCDRENIADKLSTTENRVNSHSTYMHILLLDLANTSILNARQIMWIDRWLPRLARKVFPVDASVPQIGLFLEVHLEKAQGGVLRARVKNAEAMMRYATLEELSQTLRRRKRHLITGARPANVKLGDDVDSDQASFLLSHLETAWCPPDLSHAPEAPEFDGWDDNALA